MSVRSLAVPGLVLLAAAVGAATPYLADWISTTSRRQLLFLTVAAVGGTMAFYAGRLSRRDWFFPFAFPLIYTGLALMGPVVYIAVTGRPLLGIRTGDISVTVLAIFGLTLLGMGVGAALGLVLSNEATPAPAQRVDYDRMRRLGTSVLALALPMRLYTTLTGFGLPYGTGAVGFDLESALGNGAGFFSFLGVILIVVGNAHVTASLGRPIDYWLFGAFLALTLAAGTRGSLLAPLLFALFAYHTYIRRISFRRGLTFVILLTLVFQGVTGTRAGGGFFDGAVTSIERSLSSVANPLQITYLLTERVPEIEPFRAGSTYVAALERQLPGPIAIALLGEPDDTGTYAFREIINYRDPDSGLGFAFPAEGYLNFGMVGVLVAAVLVGLLCGYAYKKQWTPPARPLHLLYPVVLATLPLNLRADAVAQVKTVLYPMIALFIIYRLYAIAASRRARLSGRPAAPVGSLGAGPAAR